MYRSMPALYICAAMLICIPPAHGINIRDKRLSWRVGVAEFTGKSLSGENSYLSSSYPLLLLESVLSADVHLLSVQERNLYRRFLVDIEMDRVRGALDDARYRRDVSAVKGTENNAQIETLGSELSEMLTFDIASIIVDEKKPVEVVQFGEQGLLPAIEFELDKTAAEHELDLLISGSIEEIESYLFVDVVLYMPAGDRIETLQIAFSRDLMEDASATIQNDLRTRVLGREWSRMIIDAHYGDADIFVDGEFRGIGRVTVENMIPGNHIVEITAPGHESFRDEVLLSQNQEAVLDVALSPVDVAQTTIRTLPEGALVYALSEYRGTSPVDMPKKARAIQAVIRKEGYADFLLPMLPDSGEVTISLLPDIMNREELLDEQRTRFYMVFAAFVMSLPIPIYLFDITNSLTSVFLAEAERSPSDRNVEEARRILTLRQISLSGYIGGFFLSVALLIDAIFELATYLDLAHLSTY
ncbi:MAG: hypothetical protein CMN78_01770 [Spirochaetales bacterium]|nr:hypothetical protein [Spirochaetales bacterium]